MTATPTLPLRRSTTGLFASSSQSSAPFASFNPIPRSPLPHFALARALSSSPPARAAPPPPRGVRSSPLDPDFAVEVHARNVDERGPDWIGRTPWDNSYALWADQGAKRDRVVPVHSWASTPTGETLTLDGRIFDHPIRTDLMHAYVRWQLAKRRAGTHRTKTRAEKRGGGRKPWNQKGSGRARHGSIRSPIWLKGGHAHARRPRSWAFKLNKKQRRLAIAAALSSKLHEGRMLVLENFQCSGETTV